MKRLSILPLPTLVVTAALALGALACGPRHEGLDASKVPENLRADYELFARRCSKCHSLARPLNAGFTDDEQWTRYVTRMRRQPGSGITPEDQEHILRFLYWYAADLRAQKAAKDAPPAAAAPAPAPLPAPTPAPQAPAPQAPASDGGAL